MTENGNRYIAWNGRVYDFDIVRACIRPKVKAIGKLVGKHIRDTVDADGNRTLSVNPSANIRRLLEEPNPYMTGQMLQEKMASQLCINNNAFAVITRDNMGIPTGIFPIVPQTAEANYSEAGALSLTFTMPNSKRFTIPYSDIIHLRQDFGDNDIFGTPICNVLAPLLDVVSTTDQGIVNAIKNSSVVRWLLKFTASMRPDDLKEQTKAFADNFLSTQNGVGVAATDSKADAVQIEPQDYVPNAAQMDKTTQRIYALFNTNQKIVDSSRTEDEWSSYFDAECEPVLRQMGGEYTRKLFSLRERGFGNRIVFEESSWDSASRATKLNLLQMVDRGALTPNEWRATFNLAPIPGGDEPIRRLDTAAVSTSTVTEGGESE
jgi:phage portal protein BeeE